LFVDWELGVLIASLFVTLVWAIAGFVGARKENNVVMNLFFIFSILEPGYIIARTIYIIIEQQPDHNTTPQPKYSTYVPLLAIVSLAVITRVLVIIWGIFTKLHFGGGLKDEIFDKETSLPFFTA